MNKKGSPKWDIKRALARMQVEPYFTEYFKNYQYPLKRIKTENLEEVNIFNLINVIRNQDSYFELSKWLYSNNICGIIDGEIMIEMGTCVFDEIKENITNEDLQSFLKGIDMWDYLKVRDQVYDWMQKNRGKYKIRRVW